jgi:hypothetical protein
MYSLHKEATMHRQVNCFAALSQVRSSSRRSRCRRWGPGSATSLVRDQPKPGPVSATPNWLTPQMSASGVWLQPHATYRDSMRKAVRVDQQAHLKLRTSSTSSTIHVLALQTAGANSQQCRFKLFAPLRWSMVVRTILHTDGTSTGDLVPKQT